MRRRYALVVAAIASIAAPLAGEAGRAAARNELSIGFTQYPSTLHPMIDSMAAKSYVLAMLRRPMTSWDASWTLRCEVCVELPTIANGLARAVERPDGTRGVAISLEIRPGLAWSDGVPVTSADAAFAIEVGRHPASGVAAQEFHRRVERVEIHDDRRITLHVDRLSYQYNDLGDLHLLPAHLERPVFQADPGAYRQRTLFDAEPTRPGLHFGPYRLAEVVAGSHLVLLPNPGW
ncbi:MAG: peptide ABC transporter substrate-binding protein, partial [Alphaproteobacteria bacterium]|nr:peptide ABC transporter substrate-binding protein [Alphaproteobacteria bacterium]